MALGLSVLYDVHEHRIASTDLAEDFPDMRHFRMLWHTAFMFLNLCRQRLAL